MPKSSDPIFFPSSELDLSLRQQMNRNYSDSINILQTQWAQADLDQRFCMGDQDIWGQLFPGVSTYRRKMFNFNLINPTIQVVTGFQRRNRKSTICVPVKKESQKTADQITKCLYYVHNKCGAYQVYSDAFEQGALTQGIGLINIYKDNVTDDINLRYVDFKSVIIDPFIRRHDLSDCRFIWTRQFFDRKEAIMLYPQFTNELMNLPGGSYRDDKFYYMPEVYQIQFPQLIAFDEYWYQSTREATFLIDKETNETQEFTGDEEDLRVIKSRFRDRLKITKAPKQTVRRTILINDKVLVDEPNPYGLDKYPYVLSLGYFTPDTPYYAYKFRGLVRDLRDPQYLFNRRKVTDLDILESQQQGLKIKKGSLVTPDDSLNTGNGRVLVIDPKFQMSDVEQMQIVPPAPGMLQMEEMLKGIMREISGVNEELLGSATDEKAGILSMLRQGAGLTSLQRLFDQCDETQRLCGNLIVEMIQKNWSYNKVKDVIGEEPTNEFDDKAFFDYGCKVIQGVLTETQQQLELGQLLNLAEIQAQNLAPPIMEKIIDTMYIQNKDELKEAMAKFTEAQNQQQQQMQQLQMQQMQVDNATKISYAKSQEGLAMERVAKIKTDNAVAMEKIRRSETEDTAQLVNVLKALKELRGLDIDHLSSQLELLHSINSIDFDATERQKLKDEMDRSAKAEVASQKQTAGV
jgi:hypothetical protein